VNVAIGRPASVAGALLVGLALACAGSEAPEVDIVLRGGTLIDGTGAPPRQADVAVHAGRVYSLGPLGAFRGAREIDVSGLVLAPGFVDVHSHADLILLADRPTQEALLGAKTMQGVTTLIVGNCGLGAAPSVAATVEILSQVNGWMTPEGISASAMEIGEYLDRLRSGGTALNVGMLVPHGPVRMASMGLAAGNPSAEQLLEMRASVARGLDDGAFGLSTGLIYPPGMFAPTAELIALAEEVASRDRLFTAHVRGSSETLVPATEELLQIARSSGVRVHHSHLEAVGDAFWDAAATVLALEDAARDEGLRVTHDVFPYTRAATMMSAIFPPWSLEGGMEALLARLEEPATRARLRREIAERRPEWPPWRPGGWPHNLVGAVGWDAIFVASVAPGGPAEWVGHSLADLGVAAEQDPFDVVADLMLSQEGRVGQLVGEISGAPEQLDPLVAILVHPAAALVSDAEDYGRGVPHPAHAGAFARALRLNRERGLLPLAELVRRMTGYPAELLGLENRGVVRKGAAADLVVFDPATVGDRATWAEPRLPAAGIRWVVLNGRVVVDDGVYRGGLHGEVLRAH
jgi:N-acyl-D-aspartate/D-glutamate deacylase